MYKNTLKVTTILCSLTCMPMLSMAEPSTLQPLEKSNTKEYSDGSTHTNIYNPNTGNYTYVDTTATGDTTISNDRKTIIKTAEGDVTASNADGSYANKNVEIYDTSTAEVYNSKTGTTTTAEKSHTSGDISASNTRGASVELTTIKGGGADITVTTATGESKSENLANYDNSNPNTIARPARRTARRNY